MSAISIDTSPTSTDPQIDPLDGEAEVILGEKKSETSKYFLIIIGILSILIGSIIAFYGKRLFRYVRFFFGFFCGLALCNAIIVVLELQETPWLFMNLLVAIILAIASLFNYQLAVGLCGGNIGLAISTLLLKELKNIYWTFGLTILTGLSCAILAVLYSKHFLIVASGIDGSFMALGGVVQIVQGSMKDEEGYKKNSGVIAVWCFVVAIILSYFAIRFQYSQDRESKDEQKDEKQSSKA